MNDELQDIYYAVNNKFLPADFKEIFSSIWSDDLLRFHAQETTILDYKENYADNYTEAYGVGLIRCASALYNTYGGIILFGVKDKTLNVVGVEEPFEIERFNRVLSDFTGHQIECLTKLYQPTGLVDKNVAAVLVPRRGQVRPAALRQALGKYNEGTLWVRDRHEVLEASARHLPLLYSGRLKRPAEIAEDDTLPVHRSIPPTPATIKDFIGRVGLLKTLWDWMIFGDQPRLYLHGPGGSGKTTLAFELAKLLTDSSIDFRLPNGELLDYVIFVSAKEIEFNSMSAKQQAFMLRNFTNVSEQFQQILFHSGMIGFDEISDISDDRLDSVIRDLFSTFNGLIVIDDIDTLSRAKKDTGEENLFLLAATCSKRTRILYTVRFPPTYALKNAIPVPGLDLAQEFVPFVEACSREFKVAAPTGNECVDLFTETSGLPLIVETVVGLRKYTSTFQEAINEYKDRSGDDARRYLYQREYDSLSDAGRARYILAALILLEVPVSYKTMCGLFQFSPEHVRDALSECSGIFLSTVESEAEGTLYQLTAPCIPFIRQVSAKLAFYPALVRKIELFRTQGASSTVEERVLIAQIERLFRQQMYKDIIDIEKGYTADNPAMMNPRIRALIGMAFYKLGPKFRERSRECFKASEAVGYHEITMMRTWYHLELTCGYGNSEAERLCKVMLDDINISPRYKCEFWSKLGSCYYRAAQSTINIDREKTVSSLKKSIDAYLEALRVGTPIKEIDLSETLSWLERPLWHSFSYCVNDVDTLLSIVELVADAKRETPASAVEMFLKFLLQIPAPKTKDGRSRVRAFCNRTIGKINRFAKPASIYPGVLLLVEPLDKLRSKLEEIDRPQ